MAVTQQDIDKLTAAIVTGARSVTLDGQSVIYNTGTVLMDTRARLQAELDAANATKRRNRQTYAYQSGRGYD